MTFREVRSDDMDAIFAIRVATWHNSNAIAELTALGITPDSVRALLRESHAGWLCEIDGQPVGFAIGNKQTGEMWVIAVLKAFEGRGVGKRLLRLVETWLQSNGWNEIWLTTDEDENVRAVGFYRNEGWEDWKIAGGDRFMRKRIGAEVESS